MSLGRTCPWHIQKLVRRMPIFRRYLRVYHGCTWCPPHTRKMIWLRQKSKWIVARKIPYGAASYRMMDYHPLAKKCGIVCCSSSRKHLRTRTEDSLFWDRERSRTSLYTTYAHTDYSTHIYLSHIGKEHVPTNRNRSSGIMTCTICDAHKPTPQYEETYLVKSSRTRATSITWLNRPTELTKVTDLRLYVREQIHIPCNEGARIS